MKNLFSSVVRTFDRQSTAKRRPTRLRIDNLEDRTVPAGGLDLSFGAGGFVSYDISGATHNHAKSVAVQPDGKVILAGFVSNTTGTDTALLRLNVDGSMDQTFGNGGLVVVDAGFGLSDSAQAVAVDVNGNIAVAGASAAGGGDTFVALLNADGALVSSFSGDGVFTQDFGYGQPDAATAVAFAGDGKIVFGGTASFVIDTDFLAARLNADGALDATFGAAGSTVVGFAPMSNDAVTGLVVQADGKVVLAGNTSGNGGDFAVARLGTDGNLDATFGVNGRYTLDYFNGQTESVSGVALDSQQRVVVTGFNASESFFETVRLTPAGVPDTTFGPSMTGVAAFSRFQANGSGGVVVDAADNVVIGATIAGGFAAARLTSGGNLDPDFGVNGVATYATGAQGDAVLGLALAPDGKIVLAGFTTDPGDSLNFAAARILNGAALTITSDGGQPTALVNVQENSTAVTTVTATGPAQTLTYSLAGGADAAKFTIDATTGVLAFVAAPDYEAPADADANNFYDVTVQVSDGTLTDTQAITVRVLPVNDNAPVITSDGGESTAYVSVAENATAVTTVTATDADQAFLPMFSLIGVPQLTYSLAGGADEAKFTINPLTGALAFVAGPDYEAPADAGANNVYDVIVQVSDGLNTDTQALAVIVTAVNDNTPVITSNGGEPTAVISVAENTTAVTTVTATDADQPAQKAAFGPAVMGGLPAQTLTYSLAGGVDAAKFSIDATTGVLTFAAAPDFEAPADADFNNVYEVVVQVSDGQTADTQSLAVIVTNAAEAPVNLFDGSAGGFPAGTQSINQDTDLTLNALNGNAVSASAPDFAEVQVTLTVTAGTVTLGQTADLTFTAGDGAGDTTVTFRGSPGAVNSALKGLVYRPDAAFVGTDTLTVTTTGVGSALTDSDVLTINVGDTPLVGLPFGDAFTRADAPTLGTDWLMITGGYRVANRQAVTTAAQSMAVVRGLSAADAALEADVALTARSGRAVGMVARLTGTARNTYYYGGIDTSAAQSYAHIYRVVNGQFTLLAKKLVTGLAGKLKFEVVGSNLKVSMNGTLLAYARDTRLTAAGAVGLRSTNPGTAFDNVRFAAVAPAPAALPYGTTFAAGSGDQLGAEWTETAGNIKVAAGVAANNAAKSVALLNGVAPASVSLSSTVTVGAGATQLAGVVARSNAAGTTYYQAALVGTATGATLRLSVFTNGFETVLKSQAVAARTGTVGLTVSGSTLTATFTGGVTLTATHAGLTSGLVGIRGVGATATWDDFTAA